jgi:signal peptidase I
MMKNWRWFISKRLREAVENRKQIVKLLAAQRDLIKSAKIDELEQALSELDAQCRGPIGKEALLDARKNALDTADRVLIPYPDAGWRDWVEMFLVVAALVLAFRTFFFQPFKIPTGSMQPTLYGITHNSMEESEEIPNFGARMINRLKGYSYHSLKAEGNWTLFDYDPPKRVIPLVSKQTLVFIDNINNKQIKKTIWFPPTKAGEPLIPKYINKHDSFKKGEYVYKIKFKTGDHLFVNRMTYNFRNPRRGDIAVFQIRRDFVSEPPPIHIYTNYITGKISSSCAVPLQKTFYIKRLVALGTEKVAIGKDRHLSINDKRLNSANPGFEFVYSRSNGEQKQPKPELNSVYSGHSARSNLFQSGPYLVPDGYYLMMGDNTYSSSDSRFWGGIQKERVIGHSSFVYWPPLSPRFGWSHH